MSLASSFFCPVCRSGNPVVFLCPVVLAGPEPVFDLVECAGCASRFFHPFPDDVQLRRFYAPGYYGADWYRQNERGRMFGRVMLPRESKGEFLDVGCSLGYFLRGVGESSGWRLHGVEISPEAAGHARNRLGIDVRCCELQEAGYPDRFFDYIHLNNVLEHVRDPLGLLLECRRILRPGGRLYLSVPNGPADSAGLLKYFGREQKPPRSKDGHLVFFSRPALHTLFRAAELGVLSAHTYGIRRGMRSLGWYPEKPGWSRPYDPLAPLPEGAGVSLPPAPRRLPGYGAYRFWQARLKRLPGLRPFGLDFEILLGAP